MLHARFENFLEVRFIFLNNVKIMKVVRWNNQLVKVENQLYGAM